MRRLTPRWNPPTSGTGFVYPIRQPLAPLGLPSAGMASNYMPTIPIPGMNLNNPTALAWQQHMATGHGVPQTPANTPAWPDYANVPLRDGLSVLPADTLHWTPGTFPPLPFGTPVPLHIHPSLLPNPLNPTIPQLQWDILHRPEQARHYTGRSILRNVKLGETAVFPSAEEIWICADEDSPFLSYWMQRWGPIMIKESNAKIIDVLDAIHAYFMAVLSDDDLRLIRDSHSPINPTPLSALQSSALKRADDAYELRDISTREYRRIDVLGGFRQFGGVRPVVFQDGTWRLMLNLLSYPVPKVA
ncbi:hypothetical protein FB45DRAFT_894634 [Roridomyces roridus]|uniref:DUF6699 domain-containing protein n=1 Tax=Roridomyces roridus TaxID=1738132 RepID=A0AAD7CG98_9AGAR|nr:hypothetical protein FB45DRAFT_894634 [Roridomyces roridus]